MLGGNYLGKTYLGGYANGLRIAVVNLFFALEFEKADITAVFEVAALTLKLE